ncbi:MAG: P1 family peptidase [Pseudomonadota bacterium]
MEKQPIDPSAEGSPGPLNALEDVPGLGIGHAHDSGVKTGVSVVLTAQPMVCAVDVRGGGPGTRETDLLDPAALVQTVDAVVLAGGSTYGLAAADAVAAHLGAAGRGFALIDRPGVPRSPIVPAAILYDLANGGEKDWGTKPPYGDLGIAAYKAAHRSLTAGPSPTQLGAVGAGFGARAGQVAGGLGSVSAHFGGGHRVGALMAVNSFGSVFIPGTQQFWAAPFAQDNELGDPLGAGADLMPGRATTPVGGMPPDTKLGAPSAAPRTNTTIGVVATSVPLTQADAKRVAIMAQDGLARAIRPVHAPTDGDVLFVLAPTATTGGNPLTLTRLGTIGADCVARAIARGVYAANRA